jgi:proteasome lid subunit RPN8/RPN11
MTCHRCKDERRRDGDPEIWIPQSVYRELGEHVGADKSSEAGGILLGCELHSDVSEAIVVIVQQALRARSAIGSATRLHFCPSDWLEFDRVGESVRAIGLQWRPVGWYHSHPAMPIKLSSLDLEVCTVFEKSAGIALVIDPVGDVGGIFVRGREGYQPNQPRGFWEMHDVQSTSLVHWTNLEKCPA